MIPQRGGRALVLSICILLTSRPGLAADPAPGLPAELRAAPVALVVWKHTYRMRLFVSGRLRKTYVVGLSQRPLGHKQKQGDNRTPEGRYRIIQKAPGPFPGAFGAYLGTRWLRLNYPNDADARAGLAKGRIDKKEFAKILAANKDGREPPKTTALGGGIGIHGWKGKWPGPDKQNLTWGCLTLQNDDLEDLYDRVPVGTPVVILP